MVAVLAAGAAVLATSQASSGVQTTTRAHRAGNAAASSFPASSGTTVRATVATDGTQAARGAADGLISGDGRWEVFSSLDALDATSTAASAGQSAIFVRDLRSRRTRQISQGTDDASTDGTPVTEAGAVPNGQSFSPSISSDGRYVSFLTAATNIVPFSVTKATTLVVCDRDPTGATDARTHDLVLDGTPPVCAAVDSNESSDFSVLDAALANRPRLSGNASLITWARSPTDSGTEATYFATMRSAKPLSYTTAAPIDSAPFTVETSADPVPDPSGFHVVYEAILNNGVHAVLRTNVRFGGTTRVDVDPAGGFLGDNAADTASGFASFDSISVSDDFSGDLAFRLIWHVTTPGFAAPAAAAAPPPTPRAYVVQDTVFSRPSSQLISLNDQGAAVNSRGVAISGDGRYVAFATTAANASEGSDVARTAQVVVRDLVFDSTANPRVAGALASPGRSCTPVPPAAICGSNGTTASELSLDDTGARVSFVDGGSDLVAGDSNNASDTFVRTWQPLPVAGTTSFGTLQTGANKVVNVPVRLTGFGPLSQITTSIRGPDAAEFTEVGENCSDAVLHVNQPCTVAVRFAPSSNGPKSARLQLTSPQLPAAVPAAVLAGTGAPTGPKNAAADTVRASLRPDGSQAAEGGNQSMVSGDGRWDVFVSRSDLTGRDVRPNNDHSNVYVRDLADPQTTVQISLHSTVGGNPDAVSRPVATAGHPKGTNPNGDSFRPTISSDGRFVSFVTAASDVVPPRFFGDHPASLRPEFTIVVCDRDPTGAKDAAGRLALDRPRPGSSIPDYVCFPVQSGVSNDGSRSVDLNSRPNLSGDGTRIAYVETDDNAPDSRRVRTADLSAPGGALHAPSGFAFVPSTVPGFEHGPDRTDESGVEQTQPVLNEDGNKVVYEAVQHPVEGVARFAVIERNLVAGTDLRVDDLGDPAAPPLQIDEAPTVSDDGNRVAFAYIDPDVDSPRVFVTTIAGTTVTGGLVSRDNSGDPAEATEPALSGDGRYLAFRAQAADMHNGVDPPDGHCNNQFEQDLRVVCEIVARDLVRDGQRAAAGLRREPNELVSTSIAKCVPNPPAGRLCGGDDDASNPSLDSTGSEVGFDTAADDIVPGDTNADDSEGGPVPVTDAFVHTWRPTVLTPTLDFGAVTLGASKTRTFLARIQDFGGTPVAFGPISLGASSIVGLNPGDYKILSTTCTGRTLHAGPPADQPVGAAPESCRFKIRFTPSRAGTRKATLQTVVGKNSYPRHNPNRTVSFDPAIVRTLTGLGVVPATPGITVNPTSLNFGTRLPEDPVTKTVTVTDSGSSPLVISAVVVKDTTHPGAHGDYSVDASDCLGTTVPGGSCVIKVTFRDHRVGVRDAVLVITDNTAAGSTSVGLLARTNKPKVESNPAVSSVQRVITITGAGFAPSHEVGVGFDHNVQATVTTNANGRFVLQMVVLPNGPQGPRTLFGHSTGFDKSIAGDFPFLVVLGSSDPGGSVVIRD